jgi:hypothetical protein
MNDNYFNPLEVDAEMVRMWSELASKMMTASLAPSGGDAPPDAARQLRAALLDAWTKGWDQFMRSPAFLEILHQRTSASVKNREQFNDFMGQWQHELQLATRQDIDRLAQSIQRVERRVADALDDLSIQIEELAVRRDATKGPETLNGAEEEDSEPEAPTPGRRKRKTRPS